MKGVIPMEFYEILLAIMEEKRMSIPAVASACGLTDSTVRSIIQRKQKRVSLDVAFKMQEGLGVSLQRLNGETEKSPAPQKTSAGDERLEGIIKNYEELNEAGKDDLAKHAEHLTYIPEYKKCDSLLSEDTKIG